MVPVKWMKNRNKRDTTVMRFGCIPPSKITHRTTTRSAPPQPQMLRLNRSVAWRRTTRVLQQPLSFAKSSIRCHNYGSSSKPRGVTGDASPPTCRSTLRAAILIKLSAHFCSAPSHSRWPDCCRSLHTTTCEVLSDLKRLVVLCFTPRKLEINPLRDVESEGHCTTKSQLILCS